MRFVTTIQNLHKDTVPVVVHETIPVPHNNQIQVDLVAEATTPGYKTDTDQIKGLLEWTLPLNPKEEKDVKLGWKVTWPQGQNLTGL